MELWYNSLTMFDREEYERWQKHAEKTLASAETDKDSGDYNWSCFKAQQAAEYSVKGFLYGLGTAAFGHSIVNLLGRFGDKVRVSDDLAVAARLLDRHYIPPRYPNSHPEGAPFEYYDLPSADEAIGAARMIVTFVHEEAKKWK